MPTFRFVPILFSLETCSELWLPQLVQTSLVNSHCTISFVLTCPLDTALFTLAVTMCFSHYEHYTYTYTYTNEKERNHAMKPIPIGPRRNSTTAKHSRVYTQSTRNTQKYSRYSRFYSHTRDFTRILASEFPILASTLARFASINSVRAGTYSILASTHSILSSMHSILASA